LDHYNVKTTDQAKACLCPNKVTETGKCIAGDCMGWVWSTENREWATLKLVWQAEYPKPKAYPPDDGRDGKWEHQRTGEVYSYTEGTQNYHTCDERWFRYREGELGYCGLIRKD
jgi:hypothetical protein